MDKKTVSAHYEQSNLPLKLLCQKMSHKLKMFCHQLDLNGSV